MRKALWKVLVCFLNKLTLAYVFDDLRKAGKSHFLTHKTPKTQTLITTFQYVCKYTGKKCCAQRIEATTSHSFKSSGVAHITHCSPTVVGGSNWKTKERIQRKHKTCERSDSQHQYPSPLFLEKNICVYSPAIVCQAYLQSRVDVVGVIHTGEGAPSMIQIKKSLTHSVLLQFSNFNNTHNHRYSNMLLLVVACQWFPSFFVKKNPSTI